jgi:hypothetical protein
MRSFRASSEKKVSCRSRARIHRCTTWTATSTFALSRGRCGRAGSNAGIEEQKGEHPVLSLRPLFQGCAGGTSIDAVLARALKIIEAHPGALRKSDVVLVTDGGSDATTAPELREAAERLNVTLLGLGIGVSIDALTPWCSEVHTVEDLTSLDAPIASRLFGA